MFKTIKSYLPRITFEKPKKKIAIKGFRPVKRKLSANKAIKVQVKLKEKTKEAMDDLEVRNE